MVDYSTHDSGRYKGVNSITLGSTSDVDPSPSLDLRTDSELIRLFNPRPNLNSHSNSISDSSDPHPLAKLSIFIALRLNTIFFLRSKDQLDPVPGVLGDPLYDHAMPKNNNTFGLPLNSTKSVGPRPIETADVVKARSNTPPTIIEDMPSTQPAYLSPNSTKSDGPRPIETTDVVKDRSNTPPTIIEDRPSTQPAYL